MIKSIYTLIDGKPLAYYIGQSVKGKCIDAIYYTVGEVSNGFHILSHGNEIDYICADPDTFVVAEHIGTVIDPFWDPEFYEAYESISIPVLNKVYKIGSVINNQKIASIRRSIDRYGIEFYNCFTADGNLVANMSIFNKSLAKFEECEPVDSYKTYNSLDYKNTISEIKDNFIIVEQPSETDIESLAKKKNTLAEMPPYTNIPDINFYKIRDKNIYDFLNISLKYFMIRNCGHKALIINNNRDILYSNILGFKQNEAGPLEVEFFRGDSRHFYFKSKAFYSTPTFEPDLIDHLNVTQVFVLNFSKYKYWCVSEQEKEFYRRCRKSSTQ